MKTVNDRIVHLIEEECNGNKSDFARRINISPAYAAQICKHERVPSERTIADICRIFNVHKAWLRHGVGPMKAEKTREEEISELVGSALEGTSEFKKAVIRMICSRTDEELKALEAALMAVYEGIKKDQGD